MSKPYIGQRVIYAGAPSGKLRPALVVVPYEGTDVCLLAVFEPHATPVGLIYVEAAEISEAEAVRSVQGFYPVTDPSPEEFEHVPEALAPTVPELIRESEKIAQEDTKPTAEEGYLHLQDADSSLAPGGTD